MSLLALAPAFVFPPLFTLAEFRLLRLPLNRQQFLIYWTANGAGTSIGALAEGHLHDAAAAAASGLLALVLWWRSQRPKRRNQPFKAIGSKARATLAALARNMPRPTAQPMPA